MSCTYSGKLEGKKVGEPRRLCKTYGCMKRTDLRQFSSHPEDTAVAQDDLDALVIGLTAGCRKRA